MKTAVLTILAAIALGGCFTTGEVRERELLGGAHEISKVCGPKNQLLNEEASSLVFVQIVNEKYAFYYRGNSEGMKEINCAFPFELGELEAWLTVNKVQYGKYVIDSR